MLTTKTRTVCDRASRVIALPLLCGMLLFCGCGKPSTLPGSAPASSTAVSATSRDLLSLADVERDSDRQVVKLSFFGSNITDAELQQLAAFGKLRELTLQECSQISDDGLAALKNCNELAVLKLIRVPVTDKALQNLQSLRSLNEILLAHTNVTGSGLSHLAGTPIAKLSIHSRTVTASGLTALSKVTTLRDLELQCPTIRVADLPSLVKLTRLESLVASRTPLGAEGLARLRGHASLQRLILNSPDVDNDGIAILNTLTELRELEVTTARVTDEGLKQLSLPKLRRLSLGGCAGVTDAGLRNLGGLPNLESLDLALSSVAGTDLTGLAAILTLRRVTISGVQFKGSSETIDALKKLLPNCEVIIMRG